MALHIVWPDVRPLQPVSIQFLPGFVHRRRKTGRRRGLFIGRRPIFWNRAPIHKKALPQLVAAKGLAAKLSQQDGLHATPTPSLLLAVGTDQVSTSYGVQVPFQAGFREAELPLVALQYVLFPHLPFASKLDQYSLLSFAQVGKVILAVSGVISTVIGVVNRDLVRGPRTAWWGPVC